MSEPKDAKSSRFQWTAEEAEHPERTIVLVPEFREPDPRDRESRLEEAVGLANAIELEVVESGVIPVRQLRPATLFGKGKVEEIAGIIKSSKVGLAIVDHAITPVQQQNLEKFWNCKVLDRTGLILEIFADRAQTKEGRLQVELAHLNYQKGRLVRSWTHLERQRGGLGFVGGPGETQIEADRRMIQSRINSLELDLEKVRKTRTLHRSGRKKVPHPIIALVGYTNAGKSTLFNSLTGAGVMAKDQLFATLDPTLRQLKLPEGTTVILSDTVGFVSNLPTHLIAAFRATLEEVIEADLILHVRDIAQPDSEAQAADVYSVLSALGIAEDGHSKVAEVWNKIDLLDTESAQIIRDLKHGVNAPILVSAITGKGTDELLKLIETRISGSKNVLEIILPVEKMGRLSWIYNHAHVIDRKDQEDGSIWLKLRAQPASRNELANLGI